jgi:hypothetical protein
MLGYDEFIPGMFPGDSGHTVFRRGDSFFTSTFSGNQLPREAILQVASTRNLGTGDVDATGVFSGTFYNNSIAIGLITENDILQLKINPKTPKATFSGTNLKTTIDNYANR